MAYVKDPRTGKRVYMPTPEESAEIDRGDELVTWLGIQVADGEAEEVAHIGDDGPRRNQAREFARQRRHGADGHAEDDEIGIRDDGAQVRRDGLGDAERRDLRDRLRAPRPQPRAKAADPPRRERNGAAEQTGTDDGEGFHVKGGRRKTEGGREW